MITQKTQKHHRPHKTTVKRLLRKVFFVSFLFIIQYLIPHAYVKICVPNTFSGFVLSPVKTLSLECVFLRGAYFYYIEFVTMYKIIFTTMMVQKMWTIKNNYLQSHQKTTYCQ